MVFMICIEVSVITLTMFCIYDIDDALLTIEESLKPVEDLNESDISWINDCLPADTRYINIGSLISPAEFTN